jgi:hypothetical protein
MGTATSRRLLNKLGEANMKASTNDAGDLVVHYGDEDWIISESPAGLSLSRVGRVTLTAADEAAVPAVIRRG